MLISLFPNAKPLPSKEEKGKEARFASKPHHPMVIKIETEDDLIGSITKNCWSPSVFNGYRSQANFVQTDLMVLDIDDGMTIEEAEKMVNNMGLAALCLPSTSHSDELHKFRLIFPLSSTINDVGRFKATMAYLAELFPADPACVGDTARFFFGCRMDAGFWSEGSLLIPIEAEKVEDSPESLFSSGDVIEVGESLEELVTALYGEKREKIPEQIHYFLENAHTGLAGEWHVCANSFLFTAAIQGCEYERIAEVFATVSPEELDKHDYYLLDRATNDGYSKRDEDFNKSIDNSEDL